MSAVLNPLPVAETSNLALTPLAGRIGAEVGGVRLSEGLATSTFIALKRALHEHKVLFLRGQHHRADAGQQGFGSLFGPLVEPPTVPSKDGTQILELDSHHGGRANS